METQQTLKDQLFALCDRHDLNYISIGVYTFSDSGVRFLGASAHGGGFCGSDTSSHDNAADAIASAISDLNGKRHSVTVPELVAA